MSNIKGDKSKINKKSYNLADNSECSAVKTGGFEVIVVLPDIRSAHNVGSIFRTADAAGVGTIYLSGYTPTPLNKFNKPQPQITKTALGAEKTLVWKYFESHTTLLNKLKKDGFKIIAVEQTKNSINYKDLDLKDLFTDKTKKAGVKSEVETLDKKVAFVFGNEVLGLPKKILEKVDVCVELPMNGMKESLNVSVTAGIVLFQYLV